jgi:hypothetical protein
LFAARTFTTSPTRAVWLSLQQVPRRGVSRGPPAYLACLDQVQKAPEAALLTTWRE